MNRRKRRKIRAVMRFSALLSLPLITAAAFRGTICLKNKLSENDTRNVMYSPSASVGSDISPENSSYSFQPPEPSDVLTGKTILSEGYGYIEESPVQPVGVVLKSPLDMVSNDPGAKPYPSKDQWNTGGMIVRTTYGPYNGVSFFDLEGGGQVNNKTSVPNTDLISESRCLPNFTITDTKEPQVLIYHTHTTESYEPWVRENYDDTFNYRTTDDTKNVVMVGDAIQAELEAAGISVIHVRTIHDYPSYNGSYERSRESIVPVLEQYPTIKVALDIHRDAISSETEAYQPFINIDGKEAAQIMIISGCDDGTLGMPNYMKNFHFACALQQQLESDFPGFTRPILFDYRHYNQDLTTGSLLIEVGSHGNTLDQAQYSGQLFGRSLASLLNSIKSK